MDPRWCPQNMFAWSAREVAWSTPEILSFTRKMWSLPVKNIEKLGLIRRYAWAGTKQTLLYVFLWLLFDPKASTNPAKYFGPKQTNPRAQDTQLPAKKHKIMLNV